ncbi:MAG: phosphoribosylglycinamide formyltransferase [Candidatus Bathyarchaeia archaeon]|jgi:phosphoribosylglycinamide formyltransferase-1
MRRLAVFASGRGSNFRAIVDHAKMHVLKNVEVCLLITSDVNAPVVASAKENNIPVTSLEGVQGKKFSTKQEREIMRNKFDEQALEILQQNRIDLVALAGFMQVLSKTLIDAYKYRIMNIHPAKNLMKFGGRGMFGERVHEAVLRSGEKESGCTVHYVDESIDGGPIILQTMVPIEPTDTPKSLAHKILIQEHRTYPKAIQLHVDERIKITDGKTLIDWNGGWEENWNRKQEALIKHQLTTMS